MVHGEDEVLLQRADRSLVGTLAGEHLDVRAHIAEIVVGLDGLEPEVEPVEAHEQHRHDRGHLQALPANFVRGDVECRLLLERGSGD